jgi:sulfoacetaldehyde acetyltransferase
MDGQGRGKIRGKIGTLSISAWEVESMGAKGIRIDSLDAVGSAITSAIKAQMEEGQTTIIEVMCTKEHGDPFRKDALSTPVRYLDKCRGVV